MQYVSGTEEVHVGCWLGNLSERDQLEDLEVGGKVILK
jgi:hypothetical protein